MSDKEKIEALEQMLISCLKAERADLIKRDEVFRLTFGVLSISYPLDLTKEDIEDARDFLDLIMRKMVRIGKDAAE